MRSPVRPRSLLVFGLLPTFLAGLWAVSTAACGANESTDLPDTESSPLNGCPVPSTMSGAPAAALQDVNARRRALGLSCLADDEAIRAAAAHHCHYYVNNSGACVPSPHKEVASCKAFTGSTFGNRMKAAGFEGDPAFEVMTYVGNAHEAVSLWVDSVWHRLPIFHPQVATVGYGSEHACDTMDFAWGSSPMPSAPVVYPREGQTGVPVSFSGNEGPEPPRPPRGWPSGYPITIYGSNLSVKAHVLTEEATGKTLSHTWLTPGDRRAYGLLDDEYILYADQPLSHHSTYRVKLQGTQDDGTALELSWTFTTG